MARLLGLNITDGHIHHHDKYYDCIFSVGEMKDAYDLTDDLIKLGFGTPSIQREITHFQDEANNKTVEYKTYRVCKNGAFAYFMHLIGAFVGKKTTQVRKLPDWILNANKPIIREFLGGLIGGDGSRLGTNKVKYENSNSYSISMSSFSQTTVSECLNETIDFIKSIQRLFFKLGIKSTVTHELAKNKNEKEKSIKYRVLLNITNTLENLNKFVDSIGFRYCYDKTKYSSINIEYLKSKLYLVHSREEKYGKFIEYLNNPFNDKSFTELCEDLNLTVYYGLNLKKKYEKNKKLLANSCGFMNYTEFRDKFNEKNEIVSISIDKIEEIPIEPVYDFTTLNDNHSFIANGIGMHNCFIETSEGFVIMALKWSRNGLLVKIEN
jgi:intein/homing endonuclease